MKLVLYALAMVWLLSCCDDASGENGTGAKRFIHSACSVTDPTKELAWLKAEIEKRENAPQTELSRYFYIAMGTHNGETVFIYGNCCPFCMTIIPVLNCEGETISYNLGDIDNVQVIWQPSGYACTL